jgi:signal transduction histidine kinase/ActR/RegA family two-component response regulator
MTSGINDPGPGNPDEANRDPQHAGTSGDPGPGLDEQVRAGADTAGEYEHRLRHARQRALDLQLLARVSSEANHAERAADAFAATLRLVCEHAGFAVAHTWTVSPGSGLLSAGITHHGRTHPELGERLRSAVVGLALPPGDGLPGIAMSRGLPVWADANDSPDLARTLDLTTGSGFAFPVRTGQGTVAVLEFWHPARKPRDTHLIALCRTIGDELGQVVERESARARLSARIAELETRLAARTTALEEARDAAQAAARAKDSFLATVSHELGTPLHGLDGSLEAIGAGVTDPALAAHVADARASALRLTHLVEHLLIVVEADSSLNTASQLHMVKPVDLLAETFGWVYESVGDVSHRVRRRIGTGSDRSFLLNDALVVRALAALLDNAVRHTAGQVLMYAQVDDSWLTFGVLDEGAGIPAAAIERLLEPLSVGTPRNRRLGLGLAVAKRLAHQLGGQLYIKAADGGGTDVRLVIPVARHFPARGGGTARVLLVDDTDINRRLTMAMLKRLGVVCDEVVDGFAALAALAETNYALVLMDIEMPGIDGRETTWRWRNDPTPLPEDASRRDVPIVAVTAHRSTAERDACLAAGMDDFMSKPFTKDDLREMVLRWSPALIDTGQPPGYR